VEDSRLLSVIPLNSVNRATANWLALELVQPNCQTYIMFHDRLTGNFTGAYHYPREIKSGFIYLDEQNMPGKDENPPVAKPEKSEAFTDQKVAN
jgi:hypothetical protein